MKTFDVNIHRFESLVAPDELKKELPMSDRSVEVVLEGRRTIERIISRRDSRLLVIAGPCSIHDEAAAMEYAGRLKALQVKVAKSIYIVMRVYFEKPRTALGWKGMISDPHLNGSYDMEGGLRKARNLLRRITGMGVPTATEFLDPVTPQYIAGLVCWAAIGARTTESQTHRELASGLSMPVGFKNGTDGTLDTAINAMVAAGSPQNFLGISPQGASCIVHTKGNPYAHLVLRGGKRPNYDSVSILDAIVDLKGKALHQAVVVDCSHDNSRKRHIEQVRVWKDVLGQRANGNRAIVGMMLESNLCEGRQEIGDGNALQYGVSITDACMSWEDTADLILGTDIHAGGLLGRVSEEVG
jgi:3-deoxy-7-phosphoheptulonate synthase